MTRGVFLFFFLVFATACTAPPSELDSIAKVNGKEIRVRDYLNLFENLKPKDVSLPSKDHQNLRNLVVQTLVRRAVIVSAADTQKIVVSDKELERGVEKYKADYPEPIFHEILLEGMVDENEWKELVRQNLLIEKLFHASRPSIKAPTAEELLDFYQNHPQQFIRNAEVLSLHIVVASEALAKEIRSKINSKKMKFEHAAKENSTGPEAQSNAQIRVEKGAMPPEIDQVLFSLPIGRLSPVVKSEYGFHLFQVISRSNPINLDFKEVRAEIEQKLFEERKRGWIERFEENLIREAEIEYNRELIAKL